VPSRISSEAILKKWLALAGTPHIVYRALKYAAGVGTVLILINHGDALLRGDISAIRIFRMVLTVIVPYCVSTASSVGAILEQSKAAAPN
jgi:hypothetical protein